MVHAAAVDINQMRGKLLTLDDVRNALASTEPLADQVFEAKSASIRLEPGWAAQADETALTTAWLRIKDSAQEEYPLTVQAALEVGAWCRLPRELQKDAPVDLVQTWVNRILAENLARSKDIKMLVRPGADGHVGTAITRPTIVPFSNLQLLDILLAGIEKQYGQGEVLADYKFTHNLERTNLRLIVPGQQRLISGTRVADDSWSAGVQLRNSLAGIEQTAIDGYLFRWWCTNGCTDNLTHVGALNRRQVSTPDDAYEWAQQAVDQVLGGLEQSLDAVQATTAIPVPPDQVAATIRDMFTEHSVPARERERVVAELAELDEDMTLYDVIGAITVVANGDKVSPAAVEQLLSLGGHAAHAATERCAECRRLLPAGYEAS